MARNIEDLAAERITPLIPAKILQSISREILTSKMTSSASIVSFEYIAYVYKSIVATFPL